MSLLEMDRSAWVLTAVSSVSELFPGTGSVVLLETVAVFEIELVLYAALTVTVTVMLGAAPTASVARVQVTVVAPEQLQPAPVALTRVVPEGNGSLRERLEALDGPLLVTARVYVRLLPAITGSGRSLLTMAKSASLTTVVSSES